MKKLFNRQPYHLLAYIALGAVVIGATCPCGAEERVVWGLPASNWVVLSWVLAGVHQGWVVFFWRMELFRGKIGEWMGDAGFKVYRAGFVLFGLTRFLAIVPVSMGTSGSLALPPAVAYGLIVVSAPFILWGMYSVFFYFGANRAFGADHFDPSYREATLEKRGIFRYIPNSMYTVVLTVLYHPGLLLMSKEGLLAAAAHHAFVWVHYFCTEKPDMKEIYGKTTGAQ